MLDVLIVGGGASGLAISSMLKKHNKSLKITVAEKMDRVGKKLAITGNGRCNITNLSQNISNYHSNSLSQALEILDNFSLDETEKFFSSLGLSFTAENTKIYPLSFQAASVVDILRFSAAKFGVNILTDTKICSLKKENDYFLATTNHNNTITSKCVVVATGGLAGGSRLGSDGDGYNLLKSFGHCILPQSPVIVQVKTDNTYTRQLKGIKVTAGVNVNKNGKIYADFGEVLFSDYGLSGPPILQLSRHCSKGSKICLDLLPDYSEKDITETLIKRKEILSHIPLSDFFAGLINKKLGLTLLKVCNINQNRFTETLTNSEISSLSKCIKEFKFEVFGNTGFANAQATSGGADLNDFDNTLMSKKCSGLFASGEVLDLDGDCGGYNLQWAWSSAAAVTNGILKLMGEEK